MIRKFLGHTVSGVQQKKNHSETVSDVAILKGQGKNPEDESINA